MARVGACEETARNLSVVNFKSYSNLFSFFDPNSLITTTTLSFSGNF
jgi:hypothetical protein